jgi:hypothetical protein
MDPKNRKKVVSANYKDRTSSRRWLIRDENQPIDAAKAFKMVKATNVTFEPSNADERGFGCARVAFCETAEGFDKSQGFNKEELTEIVFGGYDFYESKTDKVVEKVAELYLAPNGKMYAQVEALVPAEVE